MITQGYTYEATLHDSLKVTWRVEDLIGGDKTLDFSKPFLPETLAGVSGLSMLSAHEKLLLNQIRGNSYLHIFGFVEQIILPFVLDAARAAVHGDAVEVRALATFAEEEAKHIHLFERFAEEFKKGFGIECGVIGPASEVAKVVLGHSPLGVAIFILHVEWTTLAHFLDSVRDDQDLDPQFKSLLRHHWMEESQHTKFDTLLVAKLAHGADAATLDKAFTDFGALGSAVNGLLEQQVNLDLVSLEKVTARTFTEAEKQEIAAAQLKSYRYAFLVAGLVHPNFLRTVNELSPSAAIGMGEMAKQLS